MKVNKNLYWSIKVTLFLFGIIAVYKIVPHFTELLDLLIDIFNISNSDRSPELNLMFICLSLYVTISIINCIVNIIYKLQKMIKCKQTLEHSTKE